MRVFPLTNEEIVLVVSTLFQFGSLSKGGCHPQSAGLVGNDQLRRSLARRRRWLKWDAITRPSAWRAQSWSAQSLISNGNT